MMLSKFDHLYCEILNECKTHGCDENLIVEGFSIKDILGKVKSAFSGFKKSLVDLGKSILDNPIVKKVIEKFSLERKSEMLFDKMFKATEENGTLTVDIASAETSLKALEEAFPKKNLQSEAVDAQTLRKAGDIAYGGTIVAGFSGLNLFFPYLWCISLLLIVVPLLTTKIIAWKKSQVIHYRIRRGSDTVLVTDNYEEFERTLTEIAKSHCEFVAQSYKTNPDIGSVGGETVIDTEYYDPHSYSDHGKVDG